MTRTSVSIVLLALLGTLAGTVLVVGLRPAGAGRTGCSWNRIPATPTPSPSSTVLDQSDFVDRDGDGVPDRWGSSTDYDRQVCKRFTGRSGDDSLVKQVIRPTATNP